MAYTKNPQITAKLIEAAKNCGRVKGSLSEEMGEKILRETAKLLEISEEEMSGIKIAYWIQREAGAKPNWSAFRQLLDNEEKETASKTASEILAELRG